MLITLDHKYGKTKNKTNVYVTTNAVLFTLHSTMFIPTDFKELMKDKRRAFTYTNDNELYMFRILLLSHGIDEEGLKINKSGGGDIILQYLTKDKIVNMSKKNITFVNYAHNINTDKLQYMIPFFRFKIVNRQRYLEVDEITYDPAHKNRSKEKEMFYALFFGPAINKTKETFDSIESKSVTTKIDYPIKYKVLEKSKDESYIKLEITNVNFNYKIHDKLLIMNPENKYNGMYHIISTDPLVVENKLSFKFKDFFSIVNMRHTFGEDVLHKHPESRTTLAVSKSKDSKAFIPSHETVWFKDIKQYGYVYDYNDRQVVRIFTDFKTEFDKDNICFGNPSVLNKGACDRMGYMWDARCERNTDCPFYSEEQGRGGCQSGYCEVPLGVKQKAFTKYEYENKKGAFCYDCKDPLSPYCCKDENNKGRYVFKGRHFHESINFEEGFALNNKPVMTNDLYMKLKDKDSQFSIDKSKMVKASPDFMKIEFAAKRMVKDLAPQYNYHSSYDGKAYMKILNGNGGDGAAKSVYFNAICIVVKSDESREVEVIDFNCMYDDQKDRYLFNNIILRRTLISYGNLQYLSKKQIREQIYQTIDLL